MSWGKSNEAWNHTASLMSLLASIHADPKKGSPPSYCAFHPYADEPDMPEAPPELIARLMGMGGDS
jgi:hypothetical protein